MDLVNNANHKKWPVDSISVRLAHSRMHAADCESCDSEQGKEGRIDRIDKTIVVAGNLDETQIARLAEIADRCPVHRTLMNEKQIVSRVELAKRE